MEQRSQILKEMHLTKNEREREVLWGGGERSSWQLDGCPVEQAQNMNGAKRPQMLRTSRGGGGGRVATCDGSIDHLVGWCTRQSQCCLYGPVRARLSKRLLRRFKARFTASNSRQLMCQCSWEPVQTPDTASPLNVAPQPLAEASV